ncbi:hypothetical protein JOF36_003219 [Pseudonocardia parietis]|uniref:prolyl oligopeptidase n=1 Tax=Pseudonocardia parietis TaxID=570936 RepID=A0ABS4VUV8_9PSEU|nr:hypothetical protein [Pseudonocardia parietis]
MNVARRPLGQKGTIQLRNDYRMVVVSGDGRHAVAVQRIMNPVPVAVARLDGGDLEWRPFVTGVDATVAGHLCGDAWIAVTDVDAPRGRVVRIPLDSPDPDDPSAWEEIVPEAEALLRSVTPVGDVLYLAELVDTYARVRIVDRSGEPCGEVPLPGRGALVELPFPMMNMATAAPTGAYTFAFSTLASSAGTYRHHPGADGLEVLREPGVSIEDGVVEDHWATSADGTRVPFHTVRRAEATLDRPRPAMIYAYGGSNAPWVPSFPGPMAAFVAAGGVFVHGHLRGGAEFGRDWWEGGRLRNEQNSYADLYAIAETLISDGVTDPSLLAVTGGSNGGLMAEVAATQRPGLWAAAIPRVPLLDVVGACRDGYGRGGWSRPSSAIRPTRTRRVGWRASPRTTWSPTTSPTLPCTSTRATPIRATRRGTPASSPPGCGPRAGPARRSCCTSGATSATAGPPTRTWRSSRTPSGWPSP